MMLGRRSWAAAEAASIKSAKREWRSRRMAWPFRQRRRMAPAWWNCMMNAIVRHNFKPEDEVLRILGVTPGIRSTSSLGLVSDGAAHRVISYHDYMIVCLFDIDGTLLASGGAGKAALETAFTEDFSRELIHHIPYAGR